MRILFSLCSLGAACYGLWWLMDSRPEVKSKVEELLNAREIKFRILDVTNDEAERSWVITAAKSEEFPIVVVAGTPVGGFHELMQLDVTGDLKKRVFGS